MAVIGAVGSGKSSLIHTLLGEMYKRRGSVRIGVSEVDTRPSFQDFVKLPQDMPS